MSELISAAAMARVGSAVTPKAAPAGRDPGASEEARPVVSPAPANTIVRLPDYVVRERKPPRLPEPEEVMSPREREQLALQRFLGDEQGLDRALSMVTPVHLWRRIPLLGRFPFLGFETNEQRAVRLYEEARRTERLAYLYSPEFHPKAPAAPAGR